MKKLSFYAESMGAQVYWDEENRLVTIFDGETKIEIEINSNIARVNGKKEDLEVPARIINGRTVLPLRFIAKSLDKELDWKAYEGNLSIISVN